MLAHAGRHTAREILPTIDVPTLVIAGERDNMTPRALSEEMQRTIPDAELLVVEGGSHTAPIERPQLVNERVALFLAERVDPRSFARVEEQRRPELVEGFRPEAGDSQTLIQ